MPSRNGCRPAFLKLTTNLIAMKTSTRTLGLLIAAALAMAPGPVLAQGISVGPVRIAIPAGKAAELIEVRSGDFLASTLVQVTAYAWTEDEGERSLEPTDALTAIPSVFELGPGGVRNVVLQVEGNTDASRYFRIRVEEVPNEAAPPTGGGLMIRRAFDLPVFVEPAGAEARLVAKASRDPESGSMRIRVVNEGTGYALGAAARIHLGDGLLGQTSGQFYLLPGSARDILVDLPEGSSAPVHASAMRFTFVGEGERVLIGGTLDPADAASPGSSR